MFKLGDKVKIRTKQWSCNGEEGVIVQIEDDIMRYRVKVNSSSYAWWLREDELIILGAEQLELGV